jgi:hypothetical protein
MRHPETGRLSPEAGRKTPRRGQNIFYMNTLSVVLEGREDHRYSVFMPNVMRSVAR